MGIATKHLWSTAAAADKGWVFGALRVEDGKSITFTSRSRNPKSYPKLPQIDRARHSDGAYPFDR
jgi:hypothetical protein